MRKVYLKDVEPGMIIAQNIYANDGRVLLAKGIKLKQAYINRLLNLAIPALYIEEPNCDIEPPPDVISEQTRLNAVSNVREVFKEIQLDKSSINIQKVSNSVNSILDELLSGEQVLVNLSDIRSYDDYTFGHCVNVAVLSILTGINLSLNQLQLKELAMGAILHDIGKVSINKTVLSKPGKLTSEEFEEIKNHSKSGFEILRKLDNISILSSHVAFQHHEKWDGSGYPRGLREKDIHLYARIVSVADVYDALVADRVYRKAFLPHEAVDMISAGIYTDFDPEIAKAFLNNIAVFPVGSLVKLNTNEVGIVTHVQKDLQTRPVIRLITDKNGKHIREQNILDLRKQPTVLIEKVLRPKDEAELFCSN